MPAESSAGDVRRLLAVGHELSRAKSLAEVTRVLVGSLRSLHGADRAAVWLTDASDTTLELADHHGLTPQDSERCTRIPMSATCPLVDAIRRREPLMCAGLEALFAAYPTMDLGPQPRPPGLSWIFVPLIAAERAVGAMSLHFDDEPRARTVDMDLFSIAAQYGAQAIERTRLVDLERQGRARAEANAHQSATLQRITAALGQAVRPDDVARTMIDAARDELGGADSTLFRFVNDTFTPWGRPASAPSIADSDVLDVLFARAKAGEATWPGDDVSPLGVFCALPLNIGGSLVGALVLRLESPKAPCPDTRSFMTAVGREVARTLERTQLYQELAKTQERLSAILSASPLSIMLVNANERLELWNPAAQRMLGYSNDEMQGLGLPLLAPEDPAVRDLFLPMNPDGGRPARFQRKGGTAHDVTVWSSPVIHDAHSRGLLILAADLSEQKRTERLQSVLAEATRVFTTSLDFDATLEAFSQLAVPALADVVTIDLCSESLSYSRTVVACDDEAIESDLLSLRAEMPPKNMSALVDLLGQGAHDQRVFDAEPAFARHKQALLTLGLDSMMLLPLTARGRTYGVLSLAARQRTYTELDYTFLAEVAARAALALDHARLYLEVKDAVQLRDSFLAIAGHELKTPLTALKLGLQSVIRQCTTGAAPEAILERINTTARQVERLASLTNELLDVARITSGRLTLQLEPVSLGALAADVAARMQEEFARGGTELVVVVDDDVVGQWDRLRLDQVVTNLLSNALKYGKGRPVRLEVRAQNDRAVLHVLDRGIGISPADQERIFKRFERAVSDRHYGGMGLGLWIVHQIVLALDGSIAVESELGRGAKFTVELPLLDAVDL